MTVPFILMLLCLGLLIAAPRGLVGCLGITMMIVSCIVGIPLLILVFAAGAVN